MGSLAPPCDDLPRYRTAWVTYSSSTRYFHLPLHRAGLAQALAAAEAPGEVVVVADAALAGLRGVTDPAATTLPSKMSRVARENSGYSRITSARVGRDVASPYSPTTSLPGRGGQQKVKTVASPTILPETGCQESGINHITCSPIISEYNQRCNSFCNFSGRGVEGS